MTTDTQLAPTDAEIADVARKAGLLPDNSHPAPETRATRRQADAVQAFARAVLAKWGQPAHSGEPVYAFRRKGLDDFCTCTEKRYAELSAKPNLFETRIFYTAPQPSPMPQADSVLEDAAEYFLEAQAALDNREGMGINAEPYEVLMRRRNRAWDDLEAALYKARKQGANHD